MRNVELAAERIIRWEWVLSSQSRSVALNRDSLSLLPV